MTKKLVGLFASVALLGSGMALANNEEKSKEQQQSQSGQQMGGEATGGAGQQTGGMQQMGEKQVSGTVVKSSSDEVKLRTDNGIIAVKVNKDTKFQDPSLKRARDLKEGQQVRTSFEIKDDQNVAKSISLDTSMGGSGMEPDTGINQQPSDTGGSGLDQPIDQPIDASRHGRRQGRQDLLGRQSPRENVPSARGLTPRPRASLSSFSID